MIKFLIHSCIKHDKLLFYSFNMLYNISVLCGRIIRLLLFDNECIFYNVLLILWDDLFQQRRIAYEEFEVNAMLLFYKSTRVFVIFG